MQCVFLPAVLSPFHQRLARCSASVFFCAAHVPSFFFFCHHFWDEPISGQCASTTFLFSFVVFLYPPSLSVRGEATHLQHVHLFPSPLWPVTTTLVARLGPPLHPSCAVRRLPTKFRGRWCFYLGGVVSGMI